jgi:Ala-tRNA(Pro) deacylase
MSLAQTVESFLSDRHISYTLEHHAASTSSLGTAHNAHVDEDSLAKSVLLEDDDGFMLAVLPASRRLQLDRVRNELGRSLHLTPEEEMGRLFPDCQIGALPPVGAAYGLPTVLDVSLEGRDEIFFEGGDHETLVRMDGGSFLDLLESAEVVEIASESRSLCAALVIRERLYDTLLAVGRAIAAPLGSGTRWNDRLERSVSRLAEALDEHISETEGSSGLLVEIVDQAPRLWREVDGLRGEHGMLSDECGRLLERIPSGASGLALRKQAHDLIRRFERHRHLGADLVYEAFGVDVGGG